MVPVATGWVQATVEAMRAMSGGQSLAVVLGLLGLCGLGLPMPEDIILISAGYLVSLGKFPMSTAIVAGMVGVLSGDALLFFVGRRYGRALLERPWLLRWFSADQIANASDRIRSNARFICFIARFLPGLRSPIYLVSGTMGIAPSTYLLQDGLAASLSVPFWVVFGWYFGASIDAALQRARDVQVFVGLAAIIAVVVYISHQRRVAAASRLG
jgi:membrane protein DedA with SNARE-associated domain